MKYSKAAAAVAGSVIAVGVGTPAFAVGESAATPSTPSMPTNVNAGVDQFMAAQPLQRVVDGTHLDSTLQTVDRTAEGLRGRSSAGALLGQATDGARGAALSTITGALPGASMLGGLPLGG